MTLTGSAVCQQLALHGGSQTLAGKLFSQMEHICRALDS
jgi:hypothetical protein